MKKTLLHILMHNGRLLERAIEAGLSSADLHHGQGRILLNIKARGEITQADLARLMDIKPATVTNMLKPLEAKKFIRRKTDPQTNRAILVMLTRDGERACQQIQSVWEQIEDRMLEPLPQEGMDALFSALETIRNTLGGKEPSDRKES